MLFQSFTNLLSLIKISKRSSFHSTFSSPLIRSQSNFLNTQVGLNCKLKCWPDLINKSASDRKCACVLNAKRPAARAVYKRVCITTTVVCAVPVTTDYSRENGWLRTKLGCSRLKLAAYSEGRNVTNTRIWVVQGAVARHLAAVFCTETNMQSHHNRVVSVKLCYAIVYRNVSLMVLIVKHNPVKYENTHVRLFKSTCHTIGFKHRKRKHRFM